MSKETGNKPLIDLEEILDGILKWVNIESPSDDPIAVNRMADKGQDEMRSVSANLERIPGRDGFGDILIARAPWNDDRPGILVLSHMDTVHPIGTLESIEDSLPVPPARVRASEQQDALRIGPGVARVPSSQDSTGMPIAAHEDLGLRRVQRGVR